MNRTKNSRDLSLHTESHFYLPGDEIVGTVTYHPKKQVNLRSVSIVFAGEEYCVWIDKVAARVGGPISNSRAALFRKETNLVAERTRIEGRPHSWQFRFYIPRSIPPTCNYYGKATVSYWLKAKAETSFGHFDCRVRQPVTIGQFWVPQIPAPVQSTESISGGSITMNVKSSHSVVKCGDIVTLNVNFTSSSTRDLTGVRIKLKQVWECTGVFYHKNVVLKFFTKDGFPVGRGSHNSTIQLKVPHRLQTCPTVTNASRFKCTYYLAIYALSKVAGGLVKAETVKCRVPITITNLPSTDQSDSTSGPNAPMSAENSDESDSDSENEDVADRGMQQTASESNIHALHSRNMPATRSVGAIPNSSATSFDFLSNYSNRSSEQEQRDSQGNWRTVPNNDGTLAPARDDYGLASLFDEDEAQKDKEKEKQKEAGKKEVNDEITKECIICYDGAKNMLLLPCAHIATCVACTSYIMHSTKNCPVCRTKINQVMRIYPV